MTDSEPADGAWRKSTASNANGGECVEIAFADDMVRVRHSQDPAGPVLSLSYPEWKAFLAGAHNGEFDLP
ncbi:MAG: DUF397 domain-containing protein [Trebonia sp.]